jgi:poly(beta-D-mannuronate) lyase
VDELQSACEHVEPGDRLTVVAGIYTTKAPLTIAVAGRQDAPIVIAAESVGAAEIAGSHGFSVTRGGAHIAIEGFVFSHATGSSHVAAGAHHVRFLRNTFRCAGAGPYLQIGGDDVEIGYNEFRDKQTIGNMLSVTGEGGQVARRLWVHHNYFHDFANARGNGAETIRFGLSGLSMSEGHGIVEHNLFVRCMGENELISNKSCANTYRYNTIVDSPGTQLTLRHGNDCQVYGNYLRNTAGIRIFGDRHQIFSNYLESNSIAINLGNGDGEVADGSDLRCHDRPDNCVIAFNTLIDNRTHYVLTRRDKGMGGTGITFANNILQGGGRAAMIAGPNPGALWSANLVWKVEALGDLPLEGCAEADPMLARDERGIQRPATGSPAIDSAIGAYPALSVDFEGQPRTIAKDKGADESAPGPAPAGMLTEKDVGPFGKQQ